MPEDPRPPFVSPARRELRVLIDAVVDANATLQQYVDKRGGTDIGPDLLKALSDLDWTVRSLLTRAHV